MALTKVPSNLDAAVAITQSASDNSTNVATTAYVDTAIANLVDGAPAALNTLDEIAAALNDDAALNTTLTTSIATKLPLSGGTMTGAITVGAFGNTARAATFHGGSILVDGGAASEIIIGDGNIAYMSIQTTDNATAMKIRNFTGSADLVTIEKATGKVGIGTSAPTHGLTVSDIDGGGTDANMRRITIKSETHGVNSGFRFDSESANGTARAGGYYFQPGDTDATTYLGLSSTDAGYQMVITRAGNVGIGTATPSTKLDVHSATAGTIAKFFDTGSNGGAQYNGAAVVGISRVGNGSVSLAGPLFQVGNDTSSSTSYNIDEPIFTVTNANVGIGTATPALKLHVNTAGGQVVRFESSYGYMGMGPENSSYAHHQTDRPSYYFPVNCQASGGFSTYSDSRLKENVEPVTGALDKVAIMNGVTFTWDNSEKAYGPEGKQFGVLAQNMLEVDSDLPSLREDALESQENIDNADIDTQYYTMDYSRLTPFFIEAIKELKTKLEAAEARLAVLEG